MSADPFENLLLEAHPNPGRRGCPSRAQLQSIAEDPPPLDHPVAIHVRECSPCFAEFRSFRDTRRSALRRQTVWRLTGAAAAAIAVFLFFGRSPFQRSFTLAAPPVQLDFSDDSAERGSSASVAPLPGIPVGTRIVQITLPAGSEPGEYDLEIRSAADLSHPVQSLQTVPSKQAVNQRTTLSYRLSAPDLPAGNYALAWRSHGAPLWHYSFFVALSKEHTS